jgi:hypothetical protein
MNKYLALSLCAMLVLAACASPAANPTAAPAATLAPVPTHTPHSKYTPAATLVPVSQSVAPAATVVLSDTAQRIQVQGLSGPDVSYGVYRFFDPQAQVVCYVYRDTAGTGGIGGLPFQTLTFSGMSCLPVSQTTLGK